MSGADNFQAFLANHRQEKARVKALRAGLTSPGDGAAGSPAHTASPANLAAAAAAAAAMGSVEPQWQLKVHSNDPRDVAAKAAQAQATAISPQQEEQFTIGGQTFLPARNSVASPAGAQASPRDNNTTVGLIRSMTNALGNARTPGRIYDGAAIHELQELSRLADMASGGHQQANSSAYGGVTSPSETDRLKAQLDGMRSHLEQMHSVEDRRTVTETQELMSELERMRNKLRQVESPLPLGRLGVAGMLPNGDVERSLASGDLQIGGGYESPRKQYQDERSINVASPAMGERPQALTAAEARINVAYSGVKLLAQALVVLGLTLFFPGIFTPWGFVCWGNSLPLIALGLVYIYVRDPEITLPLPQAGSKSTKLFVGLTLTIGVLLVIGGSFSARGADTVNSLFWTPVCSSDIYDCTALPPNMTGVPNNSMVNASSVVCMNPSQYAGSLATCVALGQCTGQYLTVGTCSGINGVDIFVAIVCFLSALGLMVWSLWCHAVLDVRLQEYRQLCSKSIADLQDDYEFTDMSCMAFSSLLCEDWTKLVANLQRQGFGPETIVSNNRLPTDRNEQHQRRNQPSQQQHGDAGRLTAEALEARILTPNRGAGLTATYQQTPDRGSPGRPYIPAAHSTPGRPQEYY